jgi:UDP:flavonoid glycosyltransferase YjiC (YdhE family)
MELQHESSDRPVSASLKATYRALLARGLETGEAANLTAFLHGLPSAGFKWSLAEIDSIIQRRISHAAEVRAATVAATRAATGARRQRRSAAATAPTTRRSEPHGSTKVIDPPAS